jgi:hypothetical protein
MNKLPAMAKFIKEKSWVQKGGTDLSRWSINTSDRLVELQKKAVSSQLSYSERQEYFQILSKNKK